MGLFGIFKDEDENVGASFDLCSWKNLEYNDICIELSELVRNYRGSFNLSQKELAEMIGCDKKFIIKLEAGKLEDISFRTLVELWTRLNTSEFNFGCILLENIHKKVQENYNQMCKRRWER